MDLENLKKEEIIEVQDLIQEIEKLNKKIKKLQHNIGKRKKCFGYIIHFYDGVENGYIDDDSIERRIIMPTVLNEYFNEERKYHTRRSIQKLYSDVKIAEDYPEHLVLQKAFAPRLKKVVKEKIVENGKTVEIEKPIYEYPKKVKIEDFIDDYFTAEVFKHGIIGRKITMIAMYYYLYGENNPLGIRYKDGVVSFINHKGEAKFYEVHDSVKEYLDSENVGYKNKYKNFGGYEEILKIAGNEKHKVSRIEKFQDRFKRSQEIQNQNKKQIQPGEE